MRISTREGIKASEPGKPVEKVVPQPGTLSVHESGTTVTGRRRAGPQRGFILRLGDKRRNTVPEGAGGRLKQNRAVRPRWNPETHDILVIALEKRPQIPQGLREGALVFIDFSPSGHGGSSSEPKGLHDENDADYVLHLNLGR